VARGWRKGVAASARHRHTICPTAARTGPEIFSAYSHQTRTRMCISSSGGQGPPETGKAARTSIPVGMEHVTDWSEIERKFKEGVISVPEIAARHGVRASDVARAAREGGWVREARAEVRDQVHTMLMGGAGAEEAARRAVAIVVGHQSRLARMGRVADSLLDKLEKITSAKNEKEYFELRSRYLNQNESVFDALVKLTGVISKMVPLERQAFDLDDDRELAKLSDEELVRRACGDFPVGGSSGV